jgi:F0F1-type ATP synthase assembly protein I
MLDDLANLVTIIKPLMPFIGAGASAVGVVVGGFAPRIGPLRAVILAFRSKARPPASPYTNRTEELKRLQTLMKVLII